MSVSHAKPCRDADLFQFRFAGKVEKSDISPIRMRTIDIAKIQEELDRTISRKPDSIDIEFDNACTRDGWHTAQCRVEMDVLGIPCILGRVLAAKDHKRRLDTLDELTKCARNPFQANGKRILEGLAIDSCIYTIG